MRYFLLLVLSACLFVGCPKPESFTLTVTVIGSGTVALDPPGGTYSSGTSVTLSAQPNEGFIFSHWEGDLTGTQDSLTTEMDASQEVTAVFTEAGEASPIVTLAYFLIRDSDGTVPIEGTEVAMYFEPDGTADLYLGGGAEMLAYTGTYSYQSGQLTLEFTGEDFNPNATFALNTNAEQVTMPFKVFSSDAGTSLWERVEPDLVDAMNCIFRCATLSDQMPRDNAITRTVNYAKAVVAIEKSLLEAGAKGLTDDDIPQTIESTKNGVLIKYENGPPLEVTLTGLSLNTGDTGLTWSPLASDPRVNLATDSPGDASADPPCKQAIFIAPFHTTRSLVWYNGYWLNKLLPERYNEGIIVTTTGFFHFDSMASLLEDHGYTVYQLKDDNASVVTIIDNLLPLGGCATPGFVVFTTHSGDEGGLATSVLVGNTRKYGEGLKAALDTIKASSYASLLTYDGGEDYNPKTLGVSTVFRDTSPRHTASYYLSLRPKFWDWLRTQGADFSASLFFVAGCLTDRNPDLRNAIRARAYFAYNDTTTCEMTGLTFEYLCKFLTKKTRSAEEAFYNINRVSKTLQMIYPEDALFDGTIMPGSSEQVYSTYNIFRGYGYDGTKMVPYNGTGWLANTVGDDKNAGNIWWLLYASRWSQDPNNGREAILGCWDRCWKPGASCGSIGEIFCTNASPGTGPTENEVSYALFLLSGSEELNYTSTYVPRWTLNDGE